MGLHRPHPGRRRRRPALGWCPTWAYTVSVDCLRLGFLLASDRETELTISAVELQSDNLVPIVGIARSFEDDLEADVPSLLELDLFRDEHDHHPVTKRRNRKKRISPSKTQNFELFTATSRLTDLQPELLACAGHAQSIEV